MSKARGAIEFLKRLKGYYRGDGHLSSGKAIIAQLNLFSIAEDFGCEFVFVISDENHALLWSERHLLAIDDRMNIGLWCIDSRGGVMSTMRIYPSPPVDHVEMSYCFQDENRDKEVITQVIYDIGVDGSFTYRSNACEDGYDFTQRYAFKLYPQQVGDIPS